MSRPTRGSFALLYPYGAVTRYGLPFQTVPVIYGTTTGLVRISLATTNGVSVDVLSSGY